MTNKFQSVHSSLHPILKTFAEEMIHLFGQTLTSLILYGSAAGENFIPGRSNVNLLMVLKEMHFSHLQHYQRRSSYWKKSGIEPPLICTVEFLEKTKDVFPIEWMEIISHHIILHGDNPFTFTIDHQDLKRQCEKEVAEIQIRLRQAFLETENSPDEIERIALGSLNSVFPVLRTLMILQKESPPIEREKLIEAFFKKNHLSPEPFLKLWDIKKGKKIPSQEYLKWFEDYLNQLEGLSHHIDRLN
jgi:hypothetical protein